MVRDFWKDVDISMLPKLGQWKWIWRQLMLIGTIILANTHIQVSHTDFMIENLLETKCNRYGLAIRQLSMLIMIKLLYVFIQLHLSISSLPWLAKFCSFLILTRSVYSNTLERTFPWGIGNSFIGNFLWYKFPIIFP